MMKHMFPPPHHTHSDIMMKHMFPPPHHTHSDIMMKHMFPPPHPTKMLCNPGVNVVNVASWSPYGFPDLIFIFYFRRSKMYKSWCMDKPIIWFIVFILCYCLRCFVTICCFCLRVWFSGQLFWINAHGMLGAECASGQFCFEGRDVVVIFWVVTTRGRSYSLYWFVSATVGMLIPSEQIIIEMYINEMPWQKIIILR